MLEIKEENSLNANFISIGRTEKFPYTRYRKEKILVNFKAEVSCGYSLLVSSFLAIVFSKVLQLRAISNMPIMDSYKLGRFYIRNSKVFFFDRVAGAIIFGILFYFVNYVSFTDYYIPKLIKKDKRNIELFNF